MSNPDALKKMCTGELSTDGDTVTCEMTNGDTLEASQGHFSMEQEGHDLNVNVEVDGDSTTYGGDRLFVDGHNFRFD